MRDLSLQMRKIAICRKNLRKSRFVAENVKNRDLSLQMGKIAICRKNLSKSRFVAENVKNHDSAHAAISIFPCPLLVYMSRDLALVYKCSVYKPSALSPEYGGEFIRVMCIWLLRFLDLCTVKRGVL